MISLNDQGEAHNIKDAAPSPRGEFDEVFRPQPIPTLVVVVLALMFIVLILLANKPV